jgi:hypothetical protein
MIHRMRRIAPLAIGTSLAMTATGCAAIEGIFKAGVWVGVVAVAFVLCLGVAATTLLRR